MSIFPDDVGWLGCVIKPQRLSQKHGVLAFFFVFWLFEPQSGLVTFFLSKSDKCTNWSCERVVVTSLQIHNFLFNSFLLFKFLVDNASASLLKQVNQFGVVEGKHDVSDFNAFQIFVVCLTAEESISKLLLLEFLDANFFDVVFQILFECLSWRFKFFSFEILAHEQFVHFLLNVIFNGKISSCNS